MFETLQAYAPSILQGAWLTLQVALGSLALAVVIGFMGAALRLSPIKPVALLAQWYSSVVRGVPEMIWMLMIYYSLQMGLNIVTEKLGWDMIEISPLMAGILTLSFIYGAYFTETFRGAMLAIPHGQIEAAHAYGMGPLLVLRRITFPLMMRFALPGIKNNWLVLTKATALVSIIGLDDVMRLGQQAGSSTHLPLLFNLFSALLFLVLTTVSLLVFRWLEAYYQRGIRMMGTGNE
ncbi:MAG: ABC transporter permease [Brachymonas sp.]|nr:ABC transporter permease [Brachymonas sp.]